MTTIAQRLAQAEASMRVQQPPERTADDIEIERVVYFMAVRDFKEAPEDADPELVALIRDVVDRV
jgi:hypothetical protein